MNEKHTRTMIDSKHRHQRGDFLPTHLQAHQDAVGLMALAKLRSESTMTEKDTGTMIDAKRRHQRGYFLPTHLQAQQDAV